MKKWRQSKRGFTLIGIMVMVTMIVVLALLGLILYNTSQQQKAKNAVVEILQQQNVENFNAVVKANCGTIQTLIQAKLADSEYKTVKEYVVDSSLNGLFSNSGIKNPGDGAQTKNGVAGEAGCVVVTFDDALKVFSINGNAFGAGSVLAEPLIARY